MSKRTLYGTVIVTYRCNARCNMCDCFKDPTKPGEEITLEDLPESVAEGACGSARAERSAFDTEGGGEEASLREALRASRGHVKDALGMLGMSRSTFYYKCRRYGIRTGDFRCSPSGPGGEGASLGRENPLAGLSAEELQALADLARRMCRKNGGC